ncbi:hypothetical protein [Lignipirellula cremea]|uniref:Nucleoside 2-deoxyribosyltransferase n=1 Tax=Lignipirellula cremea TaxID=2528010 RepID=A0A518DV85_9BACT|nr:hypothetical protein [Lignipirellula cremea]QDU95750.1 hypothetical protein Pla8534_35670 [Lignipirellula cremea]
MRFFIAGIMQGSHRGMDLHSQNYREQLREMLLRQFSDAQVYDPLADHQNSVEYDEMTGRETFYFHNRMCREVDAVIAFVPEASMGTAIEMWEAHEHGGGAVIAISPLDKNWAVRFCSHAIYPTLEAFETALIAGEIEHTIRGVLESRG